MRERPTIVWKVFIAEVATGGDNAPMRNLTVEPGFESAILHSACLVRRLAEKLMRLHSRILRMKS